MLKYVLFDLDGTLTDSGLGITKAAQYALEDQGIHEPDASRLSFFVGPPLNVTFTEKYGMDEAQAKQAVAKYREYYIPTGIFENELYEGVPEMLRDLKEAGLHLAIASSKVQSQVMRVLKHFDIDSYFEVVVGSEPDGRRSDKREVVEEALRQLMANADETAMVGDRKFDMAGAKAYDLMAVGVSYGYGSYVELRAAGADKVADSVEDLGNILLSACGALREVC
ncbi:HAD-IA family hydrolase [Butyrivibrio sp. MC2013]|uniref:HAD-IA family hydrolase n=1 Tax=Butyrivibrio sp. MC2013 TaxID=1280686 RepID=UPI0004017792|nr:HAD-IA family hydrolase [Butyrivibrio sp. MC2013]